MTPAEIVQRTLDAVREREKHVSALKPEDVLGSETFRCNICGGLVVFDGTPPSGDAWPARGPK